MTEESALEKKRRAYKPALPLILQDIRAASFSPCKEAKKKISQEIATLFPHTANLEPLHLSKKEGKNRDLRVGVVFSGGPAAGGHNVLAGLFDCLKKMGENGELIGFINGPSGIVENRFSILTKQEIDPFRNMGGFNLIGTGRTKIEKPEELEKALKTCKEHKLDGLVIIGGDDSNTNAALLAEFFLAKKSEIRVIGVPKTIDGDLRSEDIEISFGFDSACKTYSEMIGNIAKDASSARKYTHFIKLMGRSASHITLECALSTHPNLALIGEEGLSLDSTVKKVADLIEKRGRLKKEYGVILVPEGLIEFIPEIKKLILELNALLAQKSFSLEGKKLYQEVIEALSKDSRAVFTKLPDAIKDQFLLERDPHGNVKVSQIDTQKLLIYLVKEELKARGFSGKFDPQEHFLGYEGRSCLPTNFDANYCYTLGFFAALAIRDSLTGVIGAVKNMKGPVEKWEIQAVPIVNLIHLEERKGKIKPVIAKTLVDIKGKSFVSFTAQRTFWEEEDQYLCPGPIQFFGDKEMTDSVPHILE